MSIFNPISTSIFKALHKFWHTFSS
jgi:hypothetical protein